MKTQRPIHWIAIVLALGAIAFWIHRARTYHAQPSLETACFDESMASCQGIPMKNALQMKLCLRKYRPKLSEDCVKAVYPCEASHARYCTGIEDPYPLRQCWVRVKDWLSPECRHEVWPC